MTRAFAMDEWSLLLKSASGALKLLSFTRVRSLIATINRKFQFTFLSDIAMRNILFGTFKWSGVSEKFMSLYMN